QDAQKPATPGAKDGGQNKTAPRGVEIVQHGGYPELQVDGAPFFIHSAAFFYFRIPRDQWEPLLDRYRTIGINTIDIYIPWNWHEVKPGEFDFDGNTNPRRNLRALLDLISERQMRLIARPGPEVLNEWRHGGLPDWQVSQPAYRMDLTDQLEGRYAPDDGLNSHDAEAAAENWLANTAHMSGAQAWLTAVARELAPYSSHRMVNSHPIEHPTEHSDDAKTPPPQPRSGPLLFVQLGDDFAINRTNRVGPDFWRYVETLRSALEAGGVDVPVFINPTDMRVSAAGRAQQPPIGAMGQWYLRPDAAAETGKQQISSADASDIQFFTEELKTQPDFPPVMIEYQAGWYAPADDDHPAESPPQNTLLSSRLLLANGIHGINYFPLQDTYTPAGYSVPWANRSYRWNAALGPDGDAQPRLQAVMRNAQLLERWGPALAAAHKRADFGLIYPLGAFPQDLLSAADIALVSQSVMRIERLGDLAMLSSELLDPEYQSADQMLRDAVVFLPVFDPAKPQFQLSERAQNAIVEYVRRGGALVVFPSRPAGAALARLWQGAPEAPGVSSDSAIRARWKFGEGEVIESSKDFFYWVSLSESLSQNRAQHEAAYSINALRQLVQAAGVLPGVRIADSGAPPPELLASEIVSNEGTEKLGGRSAGMGFVSVTNLSADEAADANLEILPPARSARAKADSYVPLHVVVPPRESLLLPLDVALCFDETADPSCQDKIYVSGGEFLDAHREDKMLELSFYVPRRADVYFHFAQQPAHVTLDDSKPESAWSPGTNDLKVTVPRGAAPRYVRTLKIELPYVPHVPKVAKQTKPSPTDITFSVWNSVRLPVSENQFLRTYPPLILLDPEHPTDLVVAVFNSNKGVQRDVDVSVDGPLRGSEPYHVAPQDGEIEKIRLRPGGADAMALPPDLDGLLHGTIILKLGHDRRTLPVAFLQPAPNGTNHYRYDFDRDGADEWVLENAQLRLVISPESGGRAIALMDKLSGGVLSTSMGLLRDNFSCTPNPPDTNPARARGRFGLFNRPYVAEWESEKTNPAIQLHYDAPDVFPAGAQIEKTVQFEDRNTLRADYAVALQPANGAGSSTSGAPAQSFVAINSFPASGGDRRSRFCWPVGAQSDAGAGVANSAKASAGGAQAEPHCEDFSAGGKTIDVPAGVSRIQIESSGQPTIEMQWECTTECASLKIEQKLFSALLALQFPALVPGAGAQHYTVRIRAIPAP
ncbi:MAG: beta-galactosidase, partial [Candidatus Acidiferrales bacterium]